jgi:hypothetical protein
MGLQRETVSRGVTGMYAQAFFAVVLEGLFFGVIPSLLSVLGAAIIMSSALYVVVSGHRSRFSVAGLVSNFFYPADKAKPCLRHQLYPRRELVSGRFGVLFYMQPSQYSIDCELYTLIMLYI